MALKSEAATEVDGVQQVGPSEITTLFRQAEITPRKRAHLLLHRDHTDEVQRLLIACCVGAYFRPQYHSEQWELISLLQGNADLITFNADASVIQRWSMQYAPVAQIRQNVLHTIIITAPRTLLLEVKPGPFRQPEFPSWSPEENSQEAAELLTRLSA
jgi:cupin fold WbuC family metalloprotein